MNALSMNTAFPNTMPLSSKEMPKFDLPQASNPAEMKPVSNFANLVPSNSNVDQTGPGLAEPDHHGWAPPPPSNSWRHNAQPQPWHAPSHPPAHTPWNGLPNSATAPWTHTSQVTGSLVNNNWGSPYIGSHQLERDWNLTGSQALAVTRNHDPRPGNVPNPVAHAGSLHGLVSQGSHPSGWTTPGQVQANIRENANTANIYQRSAPGMGGLDFQGFTLAMRDANAAPWASNYTAFTNMANSDPYGFGMSHVITPRDLQARGIPLTADGKFPLDRFAAAATAANWG